MTIAAKVIADSVSPEDIRLTAMQLRYPKFIHGEFMTHRVLSRNASSSRAIPVERMIQDVLDDPVVPVFWGKSQKGMQAVEELGELEKLIAMGAWLFARDKAVKEARNLSWAGAHKQVVNRLIEPWCHINVVVTSTEWANFFALRRHADAQPEMRALADAMWEARERSVPRPLKPGEWHLPYVAHEEAVASYVLDPEAWPSFPVRLSVARCARVSYLTHEGTKPEVAKDLALYDRLVGSAPMHASPAEHQATPDERGLFDSGRPLTNPPPGPWKHPEQHGNFVGWRQFRKMLPDECARDR